MKTETVAGRQYTKGMESGIFLDQRFFIETHSVSDIDRRASQTASL